MTIALIFGLLTLLSISVHKTYANIPLKELKRQARRGDKYARALHQAAAYGGGLTTILWICVILPASAFFVSFSRSANPWLAFVGCLVLLGFGFAWLPTSRVGKTSLWLTRTASPILTWLLRHLQPLLTRSTNWLQHYRPTLHTGLYEKEDLIELIEEQKVAPHNRIEVRELEIAKHALTFGEMRIRDVMTPRRQLRFVAATDPIGPILLDELHKSGFSRFPVTGNAPEEIVGTLYLRDLVEYEAGGKIKDIMSKRVYYVHEEKPVMSALDAFLKTKHHLFIVVNTFEEIVGVITIEDVLEQIIGTNIIDEFDKYDNLRAVASKQAADTHETHEDEKVVSGEAEVVE